MVSEAPVNMDMKEQGGVLRDTLCVVFGVWE